jgi:hypothetical protein
LVCRFDAPFRYLRSMNISFPVVPSWRGKIRNPASSKCGSYRTGHPHNRRRSSARGELALWKTGCMKVRESCPPDCPS